jgi:branched-chain amino acid transport system permease protein
MDLAGISGYLFFFVTMAGIYAIATLGLNIHWGFTGLFNVGLSASFAIGAYSSAILTLEPRPEHLGGFGFPIIIGWIGGAVMAGLGALLVGIPTLRLKGDYLAIATLGIATTVVLVIRNEKWLSNGVWGLRDIPQPLHGIVEPHNYPSIYMVIVLLVLAGTYFILERLINSPWGRVLRAIREDEVAAMASGKNVFSFKTQSLVLGSMVIGLAGALYAHFIRFISPDAFNPIMSTFIIWIMLTVGGRANNKGAVLGAFVVWGIWGGTEFFTNFLSAAFTTRAGFIRIILIGLLLEVMLLKRPQGLLSEMKTAPQSLRKM